MSDKPAGPKPPVTAWLSTERHEWGPRLRAEADAERAWLEKIGAVGTVQGRWVVKPSPVAIAEELLSLADLELIASIAKELDVVATPSLDNGVVWVSFGDWRIELRALRESPDPVDLVRLVLSPPATPPGPGHEAT